MFLVFGLILGKLLEFNARKQGVNLNSLTQV